MPAKNLDSLAYAFRLAGNVRAADMADDVWRRTASGSRVPIGNARFLVEQGTALARDGSAPLTDADRQGIAHEVNRINGCLLSNRDTATVSLK